MVQIRVYPLAGVRGAEVDGDPLRAAYIHRLPAKISSIAWNPFDEVRHARFGCLQAESCPGCFTGIFSYCCLLSAAGSHCLPAKTSFLPATLIQTPEDSRSLRAALEGSTAPHLHCACGCRAGVHEGKASEIQL